jgi:hypothetical protein
MTDHLANRAGQDGRMPDDPAVEDYLTELARRCVDLLGPALVGVYAGGSLALDGYRAGRSDIDVAVVVRTALPADIKSRLVAALRHESLPCPARGLELVVYRAEVAAAGDAAPGFEVELNTGARMAFRATFDPADRPAADGSFWYAIDRGILAGNGVAIVGPPAAQVFGSPPDDVLAGLLVSSLDWHLASPVPLADDAVLNACRAWHRSRTGQWLSKPAAGRAVLGADGPADPGVIEQALRARAGGAPPDPERVRRFLAAVRADLVGRRAPGLPS